MERWLLVEWLVADQEEQGVCTNIYTNGNTAVETITATLGGPFTINTMWKEYNE